MRGVLPSAGGESAIMDEQILHIEFDFVDEIKNFWFDVGKMLRKLKRRRLYLRRYHRRGERMNKR